LSFCAKEVGYREQGVLCSCKIVAINDLQVQNFDRIGPLNDGAIFAWEGSFDESLIAGDLGQIQ